MLIKKKPIKKDYKAFMTKNSKYYKISKLIQKEEYKNALELLESFIIDYPDDYFGRYDYAICLMKTGQPEMAILELEILRKKHKKKAYNVYKKLIEYHMDSNSYDMVEVLLDEAKSLLDDAEFILLKARYYYGIGRFKDANQLLENIDIKDKKELAKIFVCKILCSSKELLRVNKVEVENKINHYVGVRYISPESGRKAFLKLYTACADYEKAYDYIVTDSLKGIKPLLVSYDICIKLNKNDEAKKYLDMINSYELPSSAKLTKVQVLYINGKKNEAFDLCLEFAKTNMDAASLLCDYSIKLNRTKEAIKVLEEFLNDKIVTNNKTINIIERLLGLYIYEQRYKEAYSLLEKYDIYLDQIIREEYYEYLSKKLDIAYNKNENIHTYLVRQLREYNYNSAVKHIEKHKYQNKRKPVHTVFNDDIKGSEIMEMVRPYLTSENLYELGTVLKYQIDCRNLDINETRLIVGKIANEEDIVFCFPAKSGLQELEEELPKVKQISQLTKFKNKYNV